MAAEATCLRSSSAETPRKRQTDDLRRHEAATAAPTQKSCEEPPARGNPTQSKNSITARQETHCDHRTRDRALHDQGYSSFLFRSVTRNSSCTSGKYSKQQCSCRSKDMARASEEGRKRRGLSEAPMECGLPWLPGPLPLPGAGRGQRSATGRTGNRGPVRWSKVSKGEHPSIARFVVLCRTMQH